MMRRWTLLALVSMLVATQAAAFAPVDPQDPPPDPPGTGQIIHSGPDELRGKVPERLPMVGAFEHLPSIDESPYVVLATLNRPYWSAGYLDPVLTNACRLGDFTTVPLNRIIMRYNGPPPAKGAGPNESSDGRGVLQVVPPAYRHLLVDRRTLARPNETYFFLASAEPICQVWIRNPVYPLRKLDPNTGSSLPPVSQAAALAKAKAAIAAWPKTNN
jgi:hypothetical protein